jgi:acyl-coenzyme A thioesterase PaaI-like protein
MMTAAPPLEPGEPPQPAPAPRQARRPATPEEISRHNAAVPFNAWLGAEVLASDPTGVRVRFPWRAEFGGAPGMTHGGLLAGLIDALGRITRAGSTLCNIEIQVEDEHGRLIASGRCVYLAHARRRPPA